MHFSTHVYLAVLNSIFHLIDWVPLKVLEPSMPFYLTLSWEDDRPFQATLLRSEHRNRGRGLITVHRFLLIRQYVSDKVKQHSSDKFTRRQYKCFKINSK